MVGIKLFNAQGHAFYLQLAPGQTLELEETLPAFDTQLENGLFSLPISIPFSDENIVFLNQANHLATSNKSIPDYWMCDVEYYGLPYLTNAKFKILSHRGRFQAQTGEFEALITGGKGLFGTKIKNKKLSDLQLGGEITWPNTFDSREMAKEVIDGSLTFLQEKLSFAPILWENFIDDQRADYDGEIIANNIINHMVLNAALPNGWKFGRPTLSNPTIAIAKGATNYNDYRTIPFFKLTFVVKQIFLEHGYTLTGNFLEIKDIDKIHIFNNRSIERYDTPFVYDTNMFIRPQQHMPDMLIVDMLTALQVAFNLRFDFLPNKKVAININKLLLSPTNVVDFTQKVLASYESSERHPIVENGYNMSFEFDSNDSVVNDRVKDPKEFNVISEAETLIEWYSNPASGTSPDNSYVLIKAENYYYTYNINTSTWVAAFENLHDIRVGDEGISYKPMLSPLCHAYQDDISGVPQRLQMVATRQHGSYLNNAKKIVENKVPLRIFYIDYLTSGALTDLPISFCHNKDVNGNSIALISLSWKGVNGLFDFFYKQWITMLYDSKILKASFNLDILDLNSLSQAQLILIFNSIFLLKKVNYNLRKGDISTLELLKI